MLPLQLSHFVLQSLWFDSRLSQSKLITDLITLKIDFYFKNPNRGKRQPRLLALFLLSREFLQVQRNTKEIYEKIEKIINPVIIYYYNNCSSSDRESCTFLSFFDYFLLVLPGSLHSCQVTRLPTPDPIAVSLFLWLISATWDLTFSFSCLVSFGCCFHSSLRLFVTSLFLIIVDQF